MAQSSLPPVTSPGRSPSIRALGLAVGLGLMAGFVHGWNLSLVGLFLLVVFFNVRARLFFAVWGLGVGLSWLLLPFSFLIGRFLLDSTPVGSLLGLLSENPVVPLFGLDRYTVVGGSILALVFFVPVYLIVRGWYRSVRLRLQQRPQKRSTNEPAFDSPADFENRPPVKRRRRGSADVTMTTGESAAPLVRPYGLVGLLLGLGAVSTYVYWEAPRQAAMQILNSLAEANGAEVTVGQLGLDFWTGNLEMRDLAFADPNNLQQDRLRIARLSGRVDTAALLSGRLEMDRLRCHDVRPNVPRTRPAWAMPGVGGMMAGTDLVESAPIRPESGQFAASECLANWRQCETGVSGLARLVAHAQQFQSVAVGSTHTTKAPPFAELQLARSSLGKLVPPIWIHSLEVCELSSEFGWGKQSVLKLTDLNNNAARCPRPTGIGFEDTQQSLIVRIALAHGDSRRHQVQLQARQVSLTNCRLGQVGEHNVDCGGGHAAVIADGWLDRDGLELTGMVRDQDLVLKVAGEAAVDGIDPQVLRSKLAQTCRLNLNVRITGPPTALRLSLDPAGLREYVDRRSRMAISLALAETTEPPAPLETPKENCETATEVLAGNTMPVPPALIGLFKRTEETTAEVSANAESPASNPSVPETTNQLAEDGAQPLVAPSEPATPTETVLAIAHDIERLPPIAFPASADGADPGPDSQDMAAQSNTASALEQATTQPESALPTQTHPADQYAGTDDSYDAVMGEVQDPPTGELPTVTSSASTTAVNQMVVNNHAADTASFTFAPPPGAQSAVHETTGVAVSSTDSTSRSRQVVHPYPELAENAKQGKKENWWNQRFDRPAEATADTMVIDPADDHPTKTASTTNAPATFGQWARTKFAQASQAWPFRRKNAQSDLLLPPDPDNWSDTGLEQPRMVRQPDPPVDEGISDPR